MSQHSILRLCRGFAVLMAILCSQTALSQQVALLDSGVDPEAGLNIAAGFNYFNNTDDTSDVSDREPVGHGTVSAMAVAEAFSGPIVPFVVTDGSFESEQTNIARDNALSDILGRNAVKVIGVTWGRPGVVGSSASLLPELSNANKVIAIMAGNDGLAQPNALSTSSFNLGGVMIVGAANANGEMFDASNRAGTTANKFVVAVGTADFSDTEAFGGTSWATARIAGIAAAVFQQNPNLTNAQVVDVILQSAEDKGDVGIDAVWGNGFILNAEQVLNNVIGPIEIPTETDTGSGGGGGGAALLVGGALAGALVLARRPSRKLEKTLVLDSYGRGFHIDLNEQVTIDDGLLEVGSFFNALQQTSVNQQVYIPSLNMQISFAGVKHNDFRINLPESFAMQNDVVMQPEASEMALAFTSYFDNGVALGGGFQLDPSNFYSASAELDYNDDFGQSGFLSSQSFNSLLSGFSTQANTADLAYQAKGKKSSYKLGLVSVDQQQQYGLDSLSAIVEGKYQFSDNAGVTLQFGQLEEKGSLFGGAAGGLFGVETALTYAVNMSGNLKINEKLSLLANYGLGYTRVNASQNSILDNFDKIKSDWYSIGLVGNNVLRDRDQFGIAFLQPLKVTSGHVDYSIPKHYNVDGSIHFDTDRINLADSGATERSVETYYRTKLTDKVELGSYFTYRHNPNHSAEFDNDYIVMATMRYYQ